MRNYVSASVLAAVQSMVAAEVARATEEVATGNTIPQEADEPEPLY